MLLASRTLAGALVDSSALMCILLDEPAAPFFMAGLQATGQLYIGAATRAETWLVAFNAKGKAGAQQVEAVLGALQVETAAFTQAELPDYFDGAEHHHHNVDLKARLNMGDLFTYALAKETGLPHAVFSRHEFREYEHRERHGKAGVRDVGKRRAPAGKEKQLSAGTTEGSVSV